MDEPIEMLFGLWTWMNPRNHVLDGGPDPLMGGHTGASQQIHMNRPSAAAMQPYVKLL